LKVDIRELEMNRAGTSKSGLGAAKGGKQRRD